MPKGAFLFLTSLKGEGAERGFQWWRVGSKTGTPLNPPSSLLLPDSPLNLTNQGLPLERKAPDQRGSVCVFGGSLEKFGDHK